MKFFAHFVSESADHRYIQFSAKKQPKTDDEWRPIMDKFGLLDTEGAEFDELPGTCNSWWSLRHCEKIV